LRATLESIADAVITVDGAARVQSLNPAAERLAGVAHTDAVGRPVADVLPLVGADVIHPAHAALESRRAVGPASHTLRAGRVAVEITAAPIARHPGAVLVVRARARDAELHASEAQLRLLVDGLRDHALILLDVHGNGASWNPGAARLSGYEADEVIGRSHACFYTAADVALGVPDEALRAALACGRFSKDGVLRRKDGSTLLCEATVATLRDAAGQHVGFAVLARDVGERRRLEQAHAESAAQLRRFVEEAPVAIAMLDRELRYLVVSRRWREDFGFVDAPLVGRGHYEMFPEIPAHWKDAHRRCLAGAVVREDQEAFLRADGTTQWIRWEVRPWHTATGAIGGIIIFSEDVTASHSAEERLREAERRFRTLIEGVKDYAIYTLDPQGRVISWNSGAEKILGYRAEEILGQSCECFYTPEAVAAGVPVRDLGEAAARGSVEDEGWHMRRDGSRFWADGVLAGITDGGALRGFSRVVRDLTQRRQSDELLRSVLDSALDGIVGADAGGNILSFNRAAERLFGYAAAEVIGQNVGILMPEGMREDHLRFMDGHRRTGESKVIGVGRQLHGRRKDGSVFPLELVLTQFKLDDRPHYTAVLRDLTERIRLEEQLRQSQKMEAFGQLAGGVAHDFNNLLSVILTNCYMLVGDLPADHPTRPTIDDVRDAAQRAAGLTRQLLAFSRRQVLAPRILDLNVVVGGVEKMLSRIIGEHIELRSSFDPRLERVKVDQGQVEQVLMNLAVNARDAMVRGGTLSIATQNADLDAAAAEALGCAPGRYVRLTIADSGVGMPPETKARIFEPFFTTKGPGRGTGLGLATVLGIVQQSGGVISVDSEPGKGTLFAIHLPAVSARATPPAPRRRSKPAAPTGRETILLVEDEDAVRKVARRILERLGYRVLEASGGSMALAVHAAHREPIDLVITDVVMPEMSGAQLAEAVRARQPDQRVLFMSGYTDDGVIHHGVLQAGENFLHKPIEAEALAREVRAVLDR
jgi:PAS domain S-box-containing protein